MPAAFERHILILEADPRGHPFEWLQHLIRFLEVADRPLRLSIAVASPLAERLRHWLAAGPADIQARVTLLTLTAEEEADCNQESLWRAAMARWRTMCRYLAESGASEGHFLSLDTISLPLALGLKAHGRPLSGILFRPSVHYPELGDQWRGPMERLRDLRKHLQYRLMLRNPALRRVWSLDPYFPDYAARHYSHGHKLRPLPDPAFPAQRPEFGDSLLAELLPPERTVFVLFGVLTERKGVLALLDALPRLAPAMAERMAVMVAGAVDPPIRKSVRERLDRVSRQRPELWLRLEDRHLGAGEIEALVARSHVVLAPYQRFVGSSGVMLWAARHGRPLLTQDYGLLGHLVRQNRLGVTVDTGNPAALTNAMEDVVRRGPAGLVDLEAAAEFARQREPGNFAAAILGSAVEYPARAHRAA